jgi:hypothetical protein
VLTNSTTECGIERNFSLFSLFNHRTERNEMYFAGHGGQLIIRFNYHSITIHKINSQTKENNIIGYIKQENRKRAELANTIGIHQMNCYVSGKNETVPVLLKLTNVSKKLIKII